MNCLVCGKKLEKRWQKKYCSRDCYSKVSCMAHQDREKNHAWLDIITKEKLEELYLKEKIGIDGIAKLVGCSGTVIRKRIEIWNIPKRSYQEQMKIESESGRTKKRAKHLIKWGSFKRNRKIYLQIAKEHFDWKCGICGKNFTNSTFDLVVHHRDSNTKNNKVGNLQVLCQKCHAKTHAEMRKIKKNCVVCGKVFITMPNGKYCSKRCWYKSEWNKKKNNPIYREKMLQYMKVYNKKIKERRMENANCRNK